jgi:Protein of unknown function (DUF3078)/Protein of unknown function, DUF481
MKFTVLIALLSVSITFYAQIDTASRDTSEPQKSWALKSIFGVNGTQTSFVNWAAGGRNNVSALGFIEATANYQKNALKWQNEFKFALGGLRYIDSTGKKDGLQKTDDKIDLSSTFGYEFKKTWFYTVTAGFKTQSLNGFSFPNDSVRISTFMAPAYVNLSIGIEFAPKEYFNMYFSPLAGKMTIVNDEVLANAGAFGVEKAIYDTNGLLMTAGKRIRNEFGAYFRVKFQKEIMKNIEMKTRVELFSNYLNNPENIDVNAENIFAFKVNKWFSASLQWNLQYDDDISIRDSKGNTGPRTQFKSVLGLGISYTLANKGK